MADVTHPPRPPSGGRHNREQLERLTTADAARLASRTGTDPDDPELWITATALTGLWTVYARSLHRHLTGDDPTHIAPAVQHDLRSAADVLHRGLAGDSPPRS